MVGPVLDQALDQEVVHHPLTKLNNRHKLHEDLKEMQDVTLIVFNVDLKAIESFASILNFILLPSFAIL